MSFSIRKFLKGILIREENTLTPKEIEIIPGGDASTKTTLVSTQTSDITIRLPDLDDTLVGLSQLQAIEDAIDDLENDISDIQNEINDIQTDLNAHIAATDDVHGVTGSVVGTTDIQTLTNKTITNPLIDEILIFEQQTFGPATPATGKRAMYAKVDGFYEMDDTGNEQKIGTGSGTGTPIVDSFIGDGLETEFELTEDPITKDNTTVYISGVYQHKDTYSLSGTTLIFSEAPPSGNDIQVITGGVLSVPSGLNRDLSNLIAPVAVNQDILPESDETINLGSSILKFLTGFFDSIVSRIASISQYITFTNISTPSTPSAGSHKVYAKSDGIYQLDSSGVETKLSGGGSNTPPIQVSYQQTNDPIVVPTATDFRINFNQMTKDNSGSLVTTGPSIWSFTADRSMTVNVNAHVEFLNASWGANVGASLFVVTPSSTIPLDKFHNVSSGTQIVSLNGAANLIDLDTNDAIYIMVRQNTSIDKNLSTFCYVQIQEVK